jgi:hypothetical protein
MTKPLGLWHYEFIEGRTNGRQWRVGDADDDMVADFPTEDEARDCVRKHNAIVPGPPMSWRF